MKRFRITYEERDEERYPVKNELLNVELRSTGKILSRITTLDAYDAEVDKGFVYVCFDDDCHGADLALNANLVYKIERINED